MEFSQIGFPAGKEFAAGWSDIDATPAGKAANLFSAW
jgi:hypothetical protein